MRWNRSRRAGLLGIAVLLLAAVFAGAQAESYDASTMRLLRYAGEVEITDGAGNARFVMENARFASGESLRTGAESTASVGLDDSKIVALDQLTRVAFEQKGSRLKMTLREGTLFLDVQRKLDEAESLDIETSTMTVGIRGTIVYVRGGDGTSELGVLEGTAWVTYTDENGAEQQLDVSAGRRAVMTAGNAAPDVTLLTEEDIAGFVRGVIDADPALGERIRRAGALTGASAEGYEDAAIDAHVVITTGSASKVYDGDPLSSAQFTVTGLPEGYTLEAVTDGRITNAGSAENTLASYRILDAAGADVTARFTDVTVEAGTLRISRATLTVSTGSATRLYDGSPLTCDTVRVSGLAARDAGAVRAAATGEVVGPGSARNTVSISWGSANRNNYNVVEELGMLTVTEHWTYDYEGTIEDGSWGHGWDEDDSWFQH